MWCSTNDIDDLIGDIPVGSGVDRVKFINKAEAVMNTYFAGIYTLPISILSSVDPVTSGTTTNLLKSLQEDLSSGMFLLSLASVHEVESLHSYAKDLRGRALSNLKQIREGEITLIGATLESNPSLSKPRKILSNAPENYDTGFTSSTEALDSNSFYNRPMRETGGTFYDMER